MKDNEQATSSQEYFLNIPEPIACSRLTPSDKLVYGYINRIWLASRQHGYPCRPGRGTIATSLGLGESTVSASIAKLVLNSLIDIKTTGRTNIVTVLAIPGVFKDAQGKNAHHGSKTEDAQGKNGRCLKSSRPHIKTY